MRFEVACLLLVTFLAVLVEGKDPELRIGVKKRPETCDMRSKNGDRLSMHYTVGACLHVPCIMYMSVIASGYPGGWD